MTETPTQEAITRVWKEEAARVIGGIARLVRDVALAEDMAQDALVAALEQWPTSGIPERPGAWLMTTAKNRALNALKRNRMVARSSETIAHESELASPASDTEELLQECMDEDVCDDVLRLLFAACHPLLSQEARVALTLRMVGGLSTEEIARAFLAAETTLAQRIVRAKRTLAEARVPFEVPRGEELSPRLSSVLEVVYLIFNEGYAATAGDDLMRHDLTHEALRLGRLLATVAPVEPEVHGLLSLMLLQASRAAARVDAAGDPVLLLDQDRSKWDAVLIAQGFDALEHARRLAAAVQRIESGTCGERVRSTQVVSAVAGPYVVQAEIAACHAGARLASDTDWGRIAALYGELAELVPSPVVELNRAIAVSRAEGPSAGLSLLDTLAKDAKLERYHLLPSARADLLERLGRYEEARAEFERAAGLTDNVRQRERLRARAAACGTQR